MAEIENKVVEINKKYHDFKFFSEVTKCSKGGYLEGRINVPEEIHEIQLFLCDKKQEKEHPNSLFVSPSNRRGIVLGNDIGSSKIQIIQKKVESDTKFDLVIPNYWNAEDSSRFLGNVIQCAEF